MISYVKGDLFEHVKTYPGFRVIAHVCNNKGGWGAGFVLALSNFSAAPEKHYRELDHYQLGVNHRVTLTPELHVYNMIAQDGFVSKDRPTALDYTALEYCLDDLGKFAAWLGMSVHMPKIGSGLAGGDWDRIEKLILDKLSGVPVIVYEL